VHPILPVYDRYQRAELLAPQGDRTATARALRCADRAAAATDGIHLPAYGVASCSPSSVAAATPSSRQNKE
jgi:hypothetical protein